VVKMKAGPSGILPVAAGQWRKSATFGINPAFPRTYMIWCVPARNSGWSKRQQGVQWGDQPAFLKGITEADSKALTGLSESSRTARGSPKR